MKKFLKYYDEIMWKRDVESFDTILKLLEKLPTISPISKTYLLNRLQELQSRWPHHKLGDMPKETKE